MQVTDIADVPVFDRFPDERAGFDFELTARNARLATVGIKQPGFMKTGTTICGVRFTDGVVVAADTRSTMGDLVAEKFCSKTHVLAPNIAAVGAGTSADLQKVTEQIASTLRLQRLYQNRQSKCSMARTQLMNHLFPYMGYIGCNLIVGGVDSEGVHLFNMMSAGSSHSAPYLSMGSGGTMAMAALEIGYKDGMTREEAMALCCKAISCGILDDLYSGSQVDLIVVTAAGMEKIRRAAFPSPKEYEGPLRYPPAATVILHEVRHGVRVLSAVCGRLCLPTRQYSLLSTHMFIYTHIPI